jgi:hypothetical protein
MLAKMHLLNNKGRNFMNILAKMKITKLSSFLKYVFYLY